MKNIVIFVVLLLVIAGGVYIYSEKGQTGGSSETFAGEVIGVDLDAMAFDGPALITVRNSSGETATIAVPSMGLPLCEAASKIASVSQIKVGDTVSVEGSLDEEGSIVPCEKASHHLTVTSAN